MPSVKDIKYTAPNQPRQLRIDSIANCNASCPSCHRWLSQRDRNGEMPLELITEVLKDISRWDRPLTEIIPVNYGEFFVRKDWYEILVMINQYSPATRIVIPTNGSMLDRDTVNHLCRIPSVRIINFSLNAYFDETYQNFMELPPGNIKQIKQAVAMFKILRQDITLWGSMVFDPMYQTDLERDEFIKYWGGIGVSPQILPPASAGRPDHKPLKPVLLPCRSIFSDFVIGYDGKLSSCCFDSRFSIPLGEYSGDLRKDWHNEQITRLRELHNNNERIEIPLCKVCSFA